VELRPERDTQRRRAQGYRVMRETHAVSPFAVEETASCPPVDELVKPAAA